MSREIKFRAWDKVDRVYLGSAHPAFTSSISFEDCRGKMITKAKNKAIIFEQYTGLKDKNGKEIYEGDIVRTFNTVHFDNNGDEFEMGEVVFSDGAFGMRKKGEKENNNAWLFSPFAVKEIVGNIHEPPKDFRPEHLKRMGVSISKGGEE